MAKHQKGEKKSKKQLKEEKKAQQEAAKSHRKAFVGLPARERHPAQVLCRILQSSGLKAMGEYSQKHGLQRVIESPQVIAAVARYEKRKEDRRVGRQKKEEAAKTDESVAQQTEA
ncbi:hypothetical protein KGO95_01670 [Patescibacteria group bacterium]|nr:hypothetical protein [Patescibacteria group bacterium]